MITHRYILKGDPLGLVRRDPDNHYDAQRMAKQVSQVSLRLQHLEKEPFSGPLSIEVLFYLPIPSRGPRTTIPEGTPHIQRPYLIPLMQFVDQIGRGILWNETAQLCSMSITKQYDPIARTEIFITEIVHEK